MTRICDYGIPALRGVALLVALLAAQTGLAAEFRSVGESAAILYDAPSVKANKLFVVSKLYPVEIIVQVDNWTKVRDAAGELAWVEKKDLSDTRTLLVTATLADVRTKPEDTASVAFQARQGVALELIELGSGPWVKVRHPDGDAGYLRTNQVWGL